MTAVLSGWLVAFVLGLRHALEADHLTAVSTLVADQPRPRDAALVGALWGVGHAAALLIAGGLLLVLRLRLPPGAARGLELGVACMLVFLGSRSIRRALRDGRAGRSAPHPHGDTRHVHAGASDHVHLGPWTLARRPLLVGVVHGLAGSGALAALALASMPSLSAGLGYLVVFGVGSVGGMALLAGLAGLPLGRFARGHRAQAAALSLAGCASMAMGVAWGAPIAADLLAAW